ncbi:MlaD family protein [Vitiosangium sp. GDMCC 1.1324]|uniref:MlaD family protein n=1 Tax=Vitiosangium sp. (strain GDMCC 1.1324) TaxID=2138576 RepID=UPI000D3DA9E8|nr:MlaD family protein [Vitiosangium sp. GDMCC 1.1324]PTL84773.1 MCE family protein [Vitiosangium sp. GDMCC 1.1324]
MSLFGNTSKEQRLALRVGIFVALALSLAGLIVFLIGQETRLFEKEVTYNTYFENVQGLSPQSPVWLGGLEVGKVSGVRFPSKPGEKRLEVQLSLSTEYAQRVRRDSVARLASMGVLGDMAVDITVGSMEEPVVPPGGVIPSTPGGDLSSLMRGAAQVLEDSVAVSRTVRKAVDAYANPQVAEDLAASMRSLRMLLGEVEKGDGALHALIYDKQTGREVRRLLANTSSVALRMDKALGHVDALLDEVRHGDGTAHALIFGQEGAQSLKELGEAAEQLSGILEDAKKNPDGAVHQLVYGNAGTMLSDLGSAAADIKRITSMVASGEGSLGGIIRDPTVYEDLREVVGNVKRNRVLRALVRFAIGNNDNVQYVGRPLEPPKQEEDVRGVGGAGDSRTTLPVLPPPPPVPPSQGP